MNLFPSHIIIHGKLICKSGKINLNESQPSISNITAAKRTLFKDLIREILYIYFTSFLTVYHVD